MDIKKNHRFSPKMRAPSSLKQEFLKKWMIGLQICSSSNCSSSKQDMDILERKKAIKLTADIAMASTRNQSTCWSRALIANYASKDIDSNNKVLAMHINNPSHQRPNNSVLNYSTRTLCNKRIRSKKILKKSTIHSRIRRIKNSRSLPKMHILARSIAKRIIKKRTKVLKSLVPGGDLMDDVSLIEEALDYLVSLRAQVDIMRALAKAVELVNNGDHE